MTLFDISRTTRQQDSEIVKKSKSAKQSNSVKLSKGIQGIIDLVNQKLGKYKDRYIILRTKEELHDYLEHCDKIGIAALDTETTGLNVWRLDLAGICLYTKGQKAAYVPINHQSHITDVRYQNQCTEQEIKEEFEQFPDIKWVMHNARYDIKVLIHTTGIRLKCYWDTLIASYCIQENGDHGLKDLHLRLCPSEGEAESVTFADLFKDYNFLKVPVETATLYAAGDAEKTFDLYEYQLKIFSDTDMAKVYDVFTNIEMPIVEVVVNMEEYGVLLDTEYSAELSEKYHKLYDEAMDKANGVLETYTEKIFRYKQTHPESKIEMPLNINSPTQLAEFFYDVMEIVPFDKRNGRGTGEEILTAFAKNGVCTELCDAILDVREVKKLLSTYIDKLPNSTESDGRIHCNFNQYGAKTGRFSSSEPNLQNIPSHNTEIRKMFTAPPGRVFVGADFSQQEPVLTAHLSNDQKMKESFEHGRGIYSTIASVSFNLPYEECLEFRPDGSTNKDGKNRRTQAKSIVLGILYGRAIPSIAEQLNVDNREAQHIYDTVLAAFPQLREFMEESQTMAKTVGYVDTAWGRRRHLPDMQLKPYEFTYKDIKYSDFDPLSFTKQNLDVPIDVEQKYTTQLLNIRNYNERKEFKQKLNDQGIKVKDNTKLIDDATRQCVNARVQGSAADVTKKAMIAIDTDEVMRDLDFHIVLQIHDEIIGECPIENAKECSERLSYLMTTAASDKISIKMKCDATITQCWYGEEMVV